jgi:hypothetical protein
MPSIFNDFYHTTILGLLTVAVGAFIAYLLYLSRDRRDRFAKECALFRDAFADEISFLEHGPAANPITETAHYVLKCALDKHRRACARFKNQLWRYKRSGFERAWREYLYPSGDDKSGHEPFVDYINDSDLDGEFAIRQIALRKLYALLQFAKDT